MIYILGQTLTSDSKTRLLGKAVAYGDEWFGNESVVKNEEGITALPTGNQAVPITEPDRDYNTAKGRWDHIHFVRCILEGLRRAKTLLLLLLSRFSPTLCDPIDGSPPGSPVPGILQERTLEWVAISFSSA